MGLGGDLIFTAAVREIKLNYSDHNVHLIETNKIGKYFPILKRYFWNYSKSPVFNNNPYFSFGKFIDKSIIIDRNDFNNTYMKKELSDRFIWKDNGHAVEMICNNYNVIPSSVKPDIFFNKAEKNKYKKFFNDLPETYIVLEPNGKTNYFNTNRLYHLDRWQDIINEIRSRISIIQVGDGEGKSLENVISYNGRISIRETAWIISKAKLFIGTIGGLMHIARAVDTKSLILYSGTEKVNMVGYENNINLIKEVECSPCGLKVKCPYDRKCMDFSVSEVLDSAIKCLEVV